MNDLSRRESRVENPASRVDAGGTGQHCAVRSSIPNPDAEVSSVPPASDATGLVCTRHATVAGRSAADDWRISLHESGHCVVGRALGSEVGGVTIIPSGNYGGLTWGPLHVRSEFDGSPADEIVVPDLCDKIGPLMPGPGESRSEVVDIFSHVHIRVVELCAGTASESVFLDDQPWNALSDIRHARALAGLICSSEAAIDAYLLFGLAEAKALVVQHRAAVLAIAEALMIERTLDSAEQIDTIIANAPGLARRADWLRVLENAATFAAHGLES
jgi:hypothetical protein